MKNYISKPLSAFTFENVEKLISLLVFDKFEQGIFNSVETEHY